MTSGDPYRRIAPVYDRLIEPMQGGVREVALDVVAPQAGWSVLDVGCGTGTGLVPYLDAGCSATGVDVSAAMLAKAADRLGDRAELCLSTGDSLPFDSNRFDLVATTLVLHEVSRDTRVSLLQEMARVAKADGRLVIVDFRFGTLRGWRGRALRAASLVLERFSGHYAEFKTFKRDGGVPGLIGPTDLRVDTEKIVAGGNLAIYVAAPAA